MDELKIAPASPDRWHDLAELFQRKGPRGGTPMTAGCWCMWWRRRTGNAARNKRAMGELVRGGREPGLLAYDGGLPVGWVSVAPREEFGHLVRSRHYGPQEDEAGVWSISCFYVDPRAKRQGVATALLDAAVGHAVRRGAAAIEAYPHERGDHMGSPAMFAAAGFEPVRAASVRLIMRRAAPT
jgi:GNAT superfamily N-acetyltransferase